jgi:hypothetical protein
MRYSLFFALFCFLSFNAMAESYAELAVKSITKQKEKVEHALSEVSELTTPKETKQMRKDIGKLKIYLDVFSYAYPAREYVDLLLAYRSVLDDGYEIVGNYKDLYDTGNDGEENQAEINLKRKLMLNWRESYFQLVNTYHIDDYLKSPLADSIHERKKSERPKYYWRIIRFPEEKISDGKAVLQSLLNDMLKVSSKKLNKIMDYGNIVKHKKEENFHDFRKTVRANLKLTKDFFKDMLANTDYEVSYDLVSMAVSKFGELNDKLVVFHRTHTREIKREIKIAWTELKLWIQEVNLRKELAKLAL